MNGKTLLLTTLSLASFSCAQAQHQLWKPLYGGRKANIITQQVLQKQQVTTANKGNGITDRLVGWTIYSANTLQDSAHYKYNSTSRGSRLDNLIINSYLDFGFDVMYSQHVPYPFGISRDEPSLKYDSAYLYMVIPSPNANRKGWIGRTYSSNALTTQYIKTIDRYQGVDYASGTREDLTYNANGSLMTGHLFEDTSAALTGQYQPYSDRFFSYNSSGLALRDSLVAYNTGVAMPGENIRYAYDANNNLITATRYLYNGSAWYENNRDAYTYTAANKLATHTSYYTNGNGITQPDVTDTFGYTGNNIAYNSSYSWDANANAWVDGYLTRNYFNAQGNLDSQLSAAVTPSGLMPDNKATYTYNAYGHFDRLKSYNYNGTGYSTTPDDELTFYYEIYNATSVKTASLSGLGASIYPNPTKDLLNIRFKDGIKGMATANIYATTGQLVLSAKIDNTATQIPTDHLSPGNYIVELSNNEGSQRLQFVKL